MSHRNLGWLLAIAAVALLGIAVSYSAPTREKDRDYELVRLVVDVLQEVRQRYVVEVGPDRLIPLLEEIVRPEGLSYLQWPESLIRQCGSEEAAYARFRELIAHEAERERNEL